CMLSFIGCESFNWSDPRRDSAVFIARSTTACSASWKIASTAAKLCASPLFPGTLPGNLPDDIVLLLIGNDWRNKGLPTLLEAMSRLNHPTLRLSVVGSDTPAGFLHQVQSLQLSNRVKFYPETSEILAFYAAADIYAAPSLEDSFNLPVLEAMACGLPVLVSRLAGISDYIADGVDGILLQDPGDPSALAGSLSLLLQQPELRRSLGENAARKAQHFSWDRQADAIHRLLSGSEPEP